MIRNHPAQQKLLKLCEHTALSERLPFSKAVDLVMSQPENFELMTQAAGMRWKGKPLKSNTVRNWIDPVRKGYIKAFPNITDEQRTQIAAFIPVSKRTKSLVLKESARHLFSQGQNISQVAEKLGLSRSTVSGWKLPRYYPWHVEALKMHYNWVSGRKIAQKLGLHYNKVYRFLKDKPRGPNPYAPEDQKHVAGQEIT